MTEFVLVRHAINDWVSTGRLAGWTPGVHLNPDGQTQAIALGERLASAKLTAVYASPLERTMETAAAIVSHHPMLSVQPLDAVGEVRFGRWQGEKLDRLRKEALWNIVQTYPSRAQFPDGETIRQAQARAVDALEALALQFPKGQIAVVSHSDIIKLIVTHFLGAHVDMYQRIEISPASLTLIYLGNGRPTIVRVNDTSHLPHPPARPAPAPGLWRRLRRFLS